jgi:hypothetical protein
MSAGTFGETGSMEMESKETTFMGLQCWYKHVFEHLGWMILCRDNVAKIKVYHAAIKKLQSALMSRASTTSDPDCKKDLEIMARNVGTLQRHVEEDFKNELAQTVQMGGKRRSKSKSKSKSKSRSKSRKSKK